MDELTTLINIVPIPWLGTAFTLCKSIYLTTNNFYDNKKLLLLIVDRVYSLLIVINNNAKKYNNNNDNSIIMYIKKLEDVLTDINTYTQKIDKRHTILNILLSNDIRDNLSYYQDHLNIVINDLQLTYSININNTITLNNNHITEKNESNEYIKNMLEQNETHEKIVNDINLDYKTAFQLMQFLEKKIKNKDFNSDLKMTVANKILKAYKTTSGEHVSIHPWTLTNFEINLDNKPFSKGYDGELFKGMWLKSTKVVVKKIKLDNKSKEEFINIVDIWYNMRHEYIITLYGASYCKEFGFYVMPYIENGTLTTYFDKIKWDYSEIKRIFYEISIGMYYMHTRSYYHGDIKSNNVIIDGNNHVKIIDFDLTSNIKNKKTDIRSIRWCAPEIFDNNVDNKEINKQKQDVYSFGLLCYEILTQGRIPFDHVEEKNLVYTILHFDKFKTSDFNILIEDDLLNIINKCIDKNIDNRLSFELVSTELQKLLSHTNSLTAFSFRTTSLLKTNRKPLYTTNIYFTNSQKEENTHKNIFSKMLIKFSNKSCNNGIIEIKEFEHNVQNSITSILFYNNELFFATGKLIYIYNLIDKSILILTGHTDWVIKLYTYNDKIYSLSTDNTIRAWKNHECVDIIHIPSDCWSSACVFKDNFIYIGLWNSKIMKYNTNNSVLKGVSNFVSPIIHMTLIDEKILYCVYKNSFIKIFDISTEPLFCIQTVKLQKPISKIIILSNELFIIINKGSNIIKYKINKDYKIKYNKTIYKGIYGQIIDFVCDENYIYLVNVNNHIIKYNVKNMCIIYDIVIENKNAITCALHDNKLYVSGYDKTFHIIQ